MKQIKALRGMKDTWEDREKYLFFVDTARRIAQSYGYGYVETPIVEETGLFKRSVGETSDIVGKEMYQFEDKGGTDICMRPEGTAGVVRAFVEKKLDRQPGVQRLFYHGPMFRYERPQKGRLRQFHQFGVESFGEASPLEEVLQIRMAARIFEALGVKYEIELNSLGSPESMARYREALREFLQKRDSEICDECRHRREVNPLRALDCKNPECQKVYDDAPMLSEYLDEESERDFRTVRTMLEHFHIPYRVNPRMVRGLDYYTKTAFEFVSFEIGAQSAIAGGGRYDRLVEFLGGKATPSTGFAIGFERIVELIRLPQNDREGIYLGAMDGEAVEGIFLLAESLRDRSRAVSGYAPKSLKAHLKAADKHAARFCVVVGENERKNESVWVKDLLLKEETTLPANQLAPWIADRS